MNLKSLIHSAEVSVFKKDIEPCESDGTLVWDSLTLIVVELKTEQSSGLGYTYADPSVAHYISHSFMPLVLGESPMDCERLWERLHREARNEGTRGMVSKAISAVETLGLKTPYPRAV